MLMSTICAPRSTLKRAASAIMSDPHRRSARDRLDLAFVIGAAARFLAPKATSSRPPSPIRRGPQPNFLHRLAERAVRDPGIGATKRLLRKVREPIRIDDHGNFSGRSAILYLNMSA